jgi:N,N-dimethylformamidase beta subunit-like protein
MIIRIPIAIVFTVMLFYFVEHTSFGEQNDGKNISVTSRDYNSIQIDDSKTHADTKPPSVNITEPPYPPTIMTGKIIVKGTSNDSGSGIANVSAYVHTFPFDGHFPVKLASQPTPATPYNWSHWSFPFMINNTDSYRVVVRAIDNAGNINYAETIINAALTGKNQVGTNSVSSKDAIPKISFVRPTFTEAAYQEHGFYRFYFKYRFPSVGKNITSDLDMFTVKTPGSAPEFRANNMTHLSEITSLVPVNGTELSSVSFDYFPVPQRFWLPFIDHVKKAAPNATVTVMRDEDVHDGHIFYPDSNNMTNAYDILLLFHNEYVTQQEYDNLKQFVNNGGTIVFIDANALYAEVRYDRDNHTITLVKGHSWEFDGKAARRISVPERWYNETKEWVGSNYLVNFIKNKITFANNPFNYTHFEEQFVNNPKDSIIIDYVIKYPREDNVTSLYAKSRKVATYTLDYGNGEVIMLGLSARLLAENKEFMKFFDNVILPKALCPKFQSCFFS